MTVRRQQPEYALQKAVVYHLAIRQRPNIYWCAIPNSGGRISARTGAYLKAMGLRAGAPDLLLVIKGRAYGLELKAGKGRQSTAQMGAEHDWEDAGGEYFIARGLDEALGILEVIGAIYGSGFGLGGD